MRRQLAAGIAALGLLIGIAHAAEPEPPLEELETVLVVGEQPGPGLWKVSKGDHVMWLLASYAPLPKKMIWRSREIEARIAESQEVLYAGNVNIGVDIGLFRGLTLIPAALKAGKIPDDGTLKDVLPAETYARWLALRQKYVGKDDDIEKWRPAIALGLLRGAAFRKAELQGGPSVLEVVGRARKKYKVRRNALPDVKRTVRIEDPRGMLKSAQKLELPDVECFTLGLEKVEPEVERAKVLANAWARGDIEKLRSLHRNRPIAEAVKEECGYALMSALNEGGTADAAHSKKFLADSMWHAEQASVQARQNWLAGAQASIAKNRSTFAILSLESVLSPDGPLEKLRALGYTVEEPR
jgi:hypothetical protein